MNTHHKDQKENLPPPVHRDDDGEEYDDDGVEVIRPRSRRAAAEANHNPSHSPADADEDRVATPSKTRVKQQMHDLRDIGEELCGLGKDQLAQLDLPENLRDAIREMKNINKFGAQRRQVQYIGKLMRDVDPAPIVAKLDAWKGKSQQHTVHLHQLERWRDRLLESDAALTELLSAHPQADAQRLRTLIRNAKREMADNKPPKSYREIYRVLREIIPGPG